jgi:hypothetical protein
MPSRPNRIVQVRFFDRAYITYRPGCIMRGGESSTPDQSLILRPECLRGMVVLFYCVYLWPSTIFISARSSRAPTRQQGRKRKSDTMAWMPSWHGRIIIICLLWQLSTTTLVRSTRPEYDSSAKSQNVILRPECLRGMVVSLFYSDAVSKVYRPLYVHYACSQLISHISTSGNAHMRWCGGR